VRGTGANTPGGRGYHPAEVLRTLRASRSPRWSGCSVGCRCFRRLAWDGAVRSPSMWASTSWRRAGS